MLGPIKHFTCVITFHVGPVRYQLGLQSSEHSLGPDVQDGYLSGLAIDAGCQLEAQLGLSAGLPTCHPSMWLWLFVA